MLLSIFLPPVAAFWHGGILNFLLNLFLTAAGWIPGVIHALIVTHYGKQEDIANEQKRILKELQKQGKLPK